jgi:hypothetical protein
MGWFRFNSNMIARLGLCAGRTAAVVMGFATCSLIQGSENGEIGNSYASFFFKIFVKQKMPDLHTPLARSDI